MINMLSLIPEKLKILAKNCPFPLYVVGGTCRNFLAGLESKETDFDICAPASAEEFCNIAKACGFIISSVYKNTGTVKAVADGEEYEYTSFRSDEYVRGVHTPVKTYFTLDIKKDALRRDFTFNAIYYDIKAQEFCDPLGGIKDVKNKTVNTVREPEKVFGEDGLRLMRLARQAAAMGFSPSKQCLSGALKNCRLINDISVERIWAELDAILHADLKYGIKYAQYKGLKILKETGVLAQILPELTLGDKMEQRPDFHNHDVLEHSLRCVKYAEPEIRLAALLHDVGKPYCKVNTGKFYLHEKEGVQIADKICKRLKVSNYQTELCKKLISLHMYDLDMNTSENKLRRFIVKNYSIIPKLLKIKQADYSACKDDLSACECVKKWTKIIDKMKNEGVPFTLKQLKINGTDLLELGVEPKKIGLILNELLRECATQPSLNDKSKLLKRADKLKEEV